MSSTLCGAPGLVGSGCHTGTKTVPRLANPSSPQAAPLGSYRLRLRSRWLGTTQPATGVGSDADCTGAPPAVGIRSSASGAGCTARGGSWSIRCVVDDDDSVGAGSSVDGARTPSAAIGRN